MRLPVCSTAQPLCTSFTIIFSSFFTKVTIGFIPSVERRSANGSTPGAYRVDRRPERGVVDRRQRRLGAVNVTLTPPCISCMENREWNIQGGVRLAVTSRASAAPQAGSTSRRWSAAKREIASTAAASETRLG
jgi:hypothetical protein